MVKSTDSFKLYRCPPTPQPSYLYVREKSFVLDGVAVSTISKDYSNCNPKLGTIIPPYNGQKDPNAASYFRMQGVRSTLHRVGQSPPGTPIEGLVEELFFTKGNGFRYLSRRNEWGCGRSNDVISGHSGFAVKPIIGYSGEGGYRRNTPSLRSYPSCFGPPASLRFPALSARDSAPGTARGTARDTARSGRQKSARERRNDDAAESSKPAQQTATARSRKQSRTSPEKSSDATPDNGKQEEQRSRKSSASSAKASEKN